MATATVSTSESQQQELAMVSTLLHVLVNPALFHAPGFKDPPITRPSADETIVSPNDNASHRALKSLRALSFVLVRDQETIALLSKVLPSGVVGFLLVTGAHTPQAAQKSSVG